MHPLAFLLISLHQTFTNAQLFQVSIDIQDSC
uniref:Uncharacterized protein n=1 Tax=Arundo donax TaxID=35708 RepID=A0A0A9A6T3_ARUDO